MGRYYSQPPQPPRFERRPPKPTMHPRRVVGGIRMQFRPPPAYGADGTAAKDAEAMRALGEALELAAPDAATDATAETTPRPSAAPAWSWVAARCMRLVERNAPGEQVVEGLEYARTGQTRNIEIRPGLISAKVQGRIPTAYKTEVRLPTFSHEQWTRIIDALAAEARFSAALLGGEIPRGIEDVFAPHGLRLIPAEEQELATTCTCDVFKGKDSLTGTPREGGPTRWCKHVCCLMYLVADRISQSPLSVFSLRGLDESELLEQLRQRRALAGLARTGGGTSPVYIQHVPPAPELAAPLEEALRTGARGFWEGDVGAREALEDLDLTVQKPEVQHPLLRRLGATPFKDAKFPMVGLLATCYDLVSEDVVRRANTDGDSRAALDDPATQD